MKPHLLFVDDEPEVLELNRKYFEDREYSVDTALGETEALNLLERASYQCIVLDILMEGENGYGLCHSIKDIYKTPVIFLTNLTEEDHLVKSFCCGGDDYMPKPYRLKELEMRILARASSEDMKQQATAALRLVPELKQAYVKNQSLKLTANEFDILYFLYTHKGKPFTQQEIYAAIWGESYNTHSIQTLILRIRRKIQAFAPGREYIRTQWGQGYFYTE